MSTLALHQKPVSNPTADQRAASDPAASVWVNASAGSGKTTVLTKRVTRLLLAGVRPEKILCLTYTRAGAAEMANRITDKLSKWAVCDEAALDHDLDDLQDEAPTPRQRIEARRLFARVLSCPGGLRIRTIHSFCQEILSRFPIEAGLPPHFALIDEQEIDTLGNEVLDDLLHEIGENPQHKLAQALDILVAAQGESGFTQMLRDVMHTRGRLTEALRQAGGEKNLIAQMRSLLQLEPDDTAQSFRNTVMTNLPEDALRRLAKGLIEGTPTHQVRGQNLAEILALPAPDRVAQFDAYRQVFLTAENVPRKAMGNKEILLKYPEIEEPSEREAARLMSFLERIEAAEIAETTASVLSFGAAFAERLSQRKAARAALDYDDLILFTESLLTRQGIAPWILYKLDNGIDHILVDEAQDTSRAQWNIVQALTAEFYAGDSAQGQKPRTLFVVGDEKQSIFSFQNADPEAFLSLRNFFAQRLAEAGKNLNRIGLHTSFRSAPAILNAVDYVFAQDAARKGVSPEPVIHTASKNRDGSDKIGRVEVWPILKQAKEDAASDGEWLLPTGYEEERDPQAELAQQIAQKINGWLSRKEMLPGASRPIAPGDIMILLRRRGRFADLMVRALKANKVPVTGVDRMRLVSQLPVMDLLAVLRFVLLPEDDLNLAALLRSPLLGLSEEQLMELAIGRSDSLWHSVRSSPAFTEIRDYLAARLHEADFSTPFAFLSHVLNAPCPANATSGRKALWARLGDEALDPIEELLNEAQNFGRGHSPSLQNFLHWLTQSDTEIKRELDRGNQQDGGQVRIMTVHASKGLEAPIVFLPDTVATPRSTDIQKFQWSENNIPLFLLRKPKFGAASRLWQNARDKQLEEYRRLFYVALTRAANRLYLCGWQGSKNEGDLGNSWYGLAATALHPHHQPGLPQELPLPSREGVGGGGRPLGTESHLLHSPLPNPSPQGGGEEGGSVYSQKLKTITTAPTPEIILADAFLPVAVAPETTRKEKQKISLPAWALRSVETVSAPAYSKPASSARDTATATPDIAFARGRIIHRLLQSLPDIDPAKRTAAMTRFLALPRHNLKQAQRDEIANEVGNLLKDETFAALFAADSIAEVPLTGSIDNTPVFRQVDRLCLHGDEVWIVDYKTNRPPPVLAKDIPASYRQQLGEYRALLGGIYPDKKVRCFLLWTYAPRLMEVTFI